MSVPRVLTSSRGSPPLGGKDLPPSSPRMGGPGASSATSWSRGAPRGGPSAAPLPEIRAPSRGPVPLSAVVEAFPCAAAEESGPDLLRRFLKADSGADTGRPRLSSSPTFTLCPDPPLYSFNEVETMSTSVEDTRRSARSVNQAEASKSGTTAFRLPDSPYGVPREHSRLQAPDPFFNEAVETAEVDGSFHRGTEETDGGREKNCGTGLGAAVSKSVENSVRGAVEDRTTSPSRMTTGRYGAVRRTKERLGESSDVEPRQSRGLRFSESALRTRRIGTYGAAAQLTRLATGQGVRNVDGEQIVPAVSGGTPRRVVFPAGLDASNGQVSGRSGVSGQTPRSQSDSRDETGGVRGGSFAFLPSRAFSKIPSRLEGEDREQRELESFFSKGQPGTSFAAPQLCADEGSFADFRHRTSPPPPPAREASSSFSLVMQQGSSSSATPRLSGSGGTSFESEGSASSAPPPCTALEASAAAWRRERERAARTLFRLETARRRRRADQVAKVDAARRTHQQLQVPPLSLGTIISDVGGGGMPPEGLPTRSLSSRRLLSGPPPAAQRTSRSVADAKDAGLAGAAPVSSSFRLSKFETLAGVSGGRRGSLSGSEAIGGSRMSSLRSVVLSDRQQSPRAGREPEGEGANVSRLLSVGAPNTSAVETHSGSEVPDGGTTLRSPTLGQNVSSFTRLLTLKMIRQGHKAHTSGSNRLTPRDPRSSSEGIFGTFGTLPSSSFRSFGDDSPAGLQSLVSFTPSSTADAPVAETLRAMSTCGGNRRRRRSSSAAPPTRLETLFRSSCEESWGAGISGPFSPAARRSRSSVPSGSRNWGSAGGDAPVWLGGDGAVWDDKVKGKGKPGGKRQDRAKSNKGLSGYLEEGASPLLAAVVKEVERGHAESLTARRARERKALAFPSPDAVRDEDEEGEEGGLPGTGGGSTGFETYGEFGESRLVEVKTGRTSDLGSLKRLDVSRRFFLAALLFLKENSQTFPLWREMTRCRRQLGELALERRKVLGKERRKKRLARKQAAWNRRATSPKAYSEQHPSAEERVSASVFPQVGSSGGDISSMETRAPLLGDAASLSASPHTGRDREAGKKEENSCPDRGREMSTLPGAPACLRGTPEARALDPHSSDRLTAGGPRFESTPSPVSCQSEVTREGGEGALRVRRGEDSQRPASYLRREGVANLAEMKEPVSAPPSARSHLEAGSAAFFSQGERSSFPAQSLKSGGSPSATPGPNFIGDRETGRNGGFPPRGGRGNQQGGVVGKTVPGNGNFAGSGALSQGPDAAERRHEGDEERETGLEVSREERSGGRNLAAGYLGGDSSSASSSSDSASESEWDARELVFHTDDEVESARLRMQVLSRDSFEEFGGEGGRGRFRARRKADVDEDGGHSSVWAEREGKPPRPKRTLSGLLRREDSLACLGRAGQGGAGAGWSGRGSRPEGSGQHAEPGIDLDDGVPTVGAVFAQLRLAAAKSRSIPSLRRCLISGASWTERPLFPLLSSLLKASRSVSPPSVVVPVVAAAYALILSTLFVARLRCCRVLVECCLLARHVLAPEDLLGHEDCLDACRALRYDFARLDRLRVRQASIVLGDARRAFITVLAALYPFDFIGHPDTLRGLKRDQECPNGPDRGRNPTCGADVDDSDSSDGERPRSTSPTPVAGQAGRWEANQESLGWWHEEDEQLGELQLQADRLNQRLDSVLREEWEIREAAQEVMAELASLDQLEHEVLEDAERAASRTRAPREALRTELTASGKALKQMPEEDKSSVARTKQGDAEMRAESLAHIDMQRIEVEEKFIQLYEASKRVGEEVVRLQQQREALHGVQRRAQQERRLTIQERQKVQEQLDKLLSEDRGGSRGSRLLHRRMSLANRHQCGHFEERGRTNSARGTETKVPRPHRGVSWRAEGELRCLVEMTQTVLKTVQTQAGVENCFEEEPPLSNRPALLDEAELAFIDRLQTDSDFRAFFLSDFRTWSESSPSSESRQPSLEREPRCSRRGGRLVKAGTGVGIKTKADSEQGSASVSAGAVSCRKASSISSLPVEVVPEAPDPQAVRGLFKLIEEPLLAIRTTSTQVGASGLAGALSAVSVASWNLLDRLLVVHDQAGGAQFRF